MALFIMIILVVSPDTGQILKTYEPIPWYSTLAACEADKVHVPPALSGLTIVAKCLDGKGNAS